MCSKYIKNSCLAILICLSQTTGYALERSPWFGKDNEFEFRGSFSHSSHSEINSEVPLQDFFSASDENALDLSLGLATMGFLHAEIELVGVKGRDNRRDKYSTIDSFAMHLRYLWKNDIVGDPLSVVGGIDLAYIPEKAQGNLGNFHHGDVELTGTISLGKEKSYRNTWKHRAWAALGLGCANRGDLWTNVHLAWEKNFHDKHRVELFAKGRKGWGNQELEVLEDFESYRNFDYFTAEAGVKYIYVLGLMGELNISFAENVYAKNAPSKGDLGGIASTLTVGFFYPFGL